MSFPENVEMFSDLEPRRAMKRTRGDYDTVPIPSYGELNTARPTWEDMIIAYSTIPGKGPFVNYVSMFLPIFDQVSTLSNVLNFHLPKSCFRILILYFEL